MRKINMMMFSLTLFVLGSAQANCPRCDRINAERAANPGPHYEYYDDYLKANPNETSTSGASTTDTSTNSSNNMNTPGTKKVNNPPSNANSSK